MQDTYDMAAVKAVAGGDRTHVLNASFNRELPVGRGKWLLRDTNRVLDAVIGGWAFT